MDQRLDEVYNDLGVRDMELINKFDNGFGGVAGDNGTTGMVVNTGNFYETGRFWDMQTCQGPNEESDHEQMTLPGAARDVLVGDLLDKLLPGGTLPAYPAPPHCNTRGLSAAGRPPGQRHDRQADDHRPRPPRRDLAQAAAVDRRGGALLGRRVVHSWSTADAYPRIYKLGGFVTPYAGSSVAFAAQWKRLMAVRDKRFLRAIGWGADMNGFGAQGPPRGGDNPVQYPFKSFDGRVTFERQKTGDRVFDINTMGVAHYGLYPDWVEDLRHVAGDQIVKDLANGSEAYLEMWERAVGITPRYVCKSRRLKFSRGGLGNVAFGVSAEDELRSAGQPLSRVGHYYSLLRARRRQREGALRPARDGRPDQLPRGAPCEDADASSRSSRSVSIRAVAPQMRFSPTT